MASLIMGAIVLAYVSYASMQGTGSANFLVGHSVILVIGGTFGVLFFATPMKVLQTLIRSTRDLFRPDASVIDVKSDLDLLSINRSATVDSENPLMKYAADLWSQGVDPDLFTVLLSQKKREIDMRSLDAVQALRNLAKYPPALGMTGTVIGMIGLFADLDSNKGSIGQNLSIAMTATFLGLVLANLLISPLADRLQIQHAKSQQFNSNLYELLLLINRGEAKSLIQDEINGRAA